MEYTSSYARQASLFRRSRDTWRKRAADKQQAIRALRVKVRDLTLSRDHWKDHAQQLQAQMIQLQAQLASRPAEESPWGNR